MSETNSILASDLPKRQRRQEIDKLLIRDTSTSKNQSIESLYERNQACGF